MDAEKAQAAAKAHADAQSQVQDEVSRMLSAERALAQGSLQQALVRERLAAEDERHRAHVFVSLSSFLSSFFFFSFPAFYQTGGKQVTYDH